MIIPKIQDKLLYPEILWQKPLNIFKKMGGVLVFGNEKQDKDFLKFGEILYFFNLRKVLLAVSENLAVHYKNLIPDELLFLLPSIKEKQAISKIYEKVVRHKNDFDIIVLCIGSSNNFVTQEIIHKIKTILKPIIFLNQPCQKRESTSVYFLDEKGAGLWINAKPQNVLENPIFALANLNKFLQNDDIIILSLEKKIFVQNKEKTVLTNVPKDDKILLAALVAAFWSQNINKPFESAATAAFITKVFLENNHQIKNIDKVINQIGG